MCCHTGELPVQIPATNLVPLPPVPTVPPQIAQTPPQPPAAPVIAPRAIDPQEPGYKGPAVNSSASRQSAAGERTERNRSSSSGRRRGGEVDLFV